MWKELIEACAANDLEWVTFHLLFVFEPGLDTSYKITWATSWENLFLQYANNKGADQPAHPCSLISTFVVHCLDSIIPLVSISENFKPSPSFCGCAGRFECTLVANPEDRFSRDKAHMRAHRRLRAACRFFRAPAHFSLMKYGLWFSAISASDI